MVFSSVADSAGLVEDCDFLLGTDANSYPLVAKARNINRRLDETVSLILQCDGRWQWDDTNQSDLPIVSTTLVDSQQDYEFTGATYLKITRVEVKDVNGNYYLLTPIDQNDVTSQAMTEFQKTPGRPIYYDKMGDSIMLYPKPSSSAVTLTNGLKVYYQRGPSYFASTDTTKVPGFAPIFHRILSLGAAIDYAMANGMNSKIQTFSPVLTKLQSDLVTFYEGRIRDERVRGSIARENYGQPDGVGTQRAASDRVAFY